MTAGSFPRTRHRPTSRLARWRAFPRRCSRRRGPGAHGPSRPAGKLARLAYYYFFGVVTCQSQPVQWRCGRDQPDAAYRYLPGPPGPLPPGPAIPSLDLITHSAIPNTRARACVAHCESLAHPPCVAASRTVASRDPRLREQRACEQSACTESPLPRRATQVGVNSKPSK